MWSLSSNGRWFSRTVSVRYLTRRYAYNSCVNVPSPARGNFTVEHAVNRVFTTTVANPILGVYGDGQNHKDLGVSRDGKPPGSDCITNPNSLCCFSSYIPLLLILLLIKSTHRTRPWLQARRLLFLISRIFPKSPPKTSLYLAFCTSESDGGHALFRPLLNYISSTPWKRIATYQVPDLPACPAGGCICAVSGLAYWSVACVLIICVHKFGWVANGCGEPNMYMQGFRCKVTNVATNSTGVRTLAPARAPLWCADNTTNCRKGAKQVSSPLRET